MKRVINAIFFFLAFIIIQIPVSGQDLHFSQYYNSPLNINPGMIGVFNGDMRFAGNYRNQWETVSVPYTTFSAAFDTRIPMKKDAKGFFSYGALFDYDVAGDGDFGIIQLGIGGSYTRQVSRKNFLSIGLLLNAGQWGYDQKNLLFDNAWNGDAIDPNLGSGESFTRDNIFYADMNIGINWRWQESKRTKVDFGIGAYHLNGPNKSFYEESGLNVPRRYALHVISSIKVANKLDVLLSGVGQYQNPYAEILLGIMGKIHLSQQKGKEVALSLGGSLRLSDALVPVIALDYNSWHVGFSYDINTTPFQIATERRGGPEISVVYIINKVHPLDEVKVCPIY